MFEFIVVLGAATLVAILFHAWKMPPVVAFFTAGMLVGPHGLGLVTSTPNMTLMTEGAALLLMFTIGLEFSLKKLIEMRKSLILMGFGQVGICSLVFTCLFQWTLDFPLEKAIFLSFLASLSSTAVVLKILSDERDFETPHGSASFSILLSQDIAVIPMIIAIPFLRNINEMASGFLDSLLPMTILALFGLALFFVLNRYLLPSLLHRVARTGSREIFFFCIVFIFASLAMLLHKVGLSISLGAFIAGMLIAGSPYGKQATADFLPLRDAFLGLFFVVVGMMLDTGFFIQNFHKILTMGVLVLGIKILLIFLLIWFLGNSGTVARITSLLVFQMGEFSFVLADQGLELGLLTEKDMQYFIAISVMSLIATPFSYRLLPKLSEPHRFQGLVPNKLYQEASKWRSQLLKTLSATTITHEDAPKLENHVVIVGYGVAGQALARTLKGLGFPYIIVETNSETVNKFRKQEPIIFGDAGSEEILERAHAKDARMIVLVTSSVTTIEPVLGTLSRYCTGVPVLVRTNYLQDLDRLSRLPNIHFVVSELEATLALIERTLHQKEIDSNKIRAFVHELHKELSESYKLN